MPALCAAALLPLPTAVRAALSLQEGEHLALEGVEVPEAPMDRLEHELVVDAPVLVDQKVAEPYHAPEGGGHGPRDRAVSRESLEEVILLARQPQPEPHHEQGADVDD